ncbi:hypothetical protein DRF60_12590 [Chryseobacterium elymi]|uniref:Uncharacterized protein n=1 Tax=Chryseobacterium elymi TaxID=395936 RepID=A0A3D9DFF0_9FLAO|nr:hypothetical protein DRF60_12590 [Chryseobacterium elymi]
MKGKFYQYLYSLLFALLTVLGWYYGQLQQYVSVEDNELGFHFCSTCDKSSEKSFVLIKEHEGQDLYNEVILTFYD